MAVLLVLLLLLPSVAFANEFGYGCVDEGGDACVQYYYNEGDFIRFFVEGVNVDAWTQAVDWHRTNNVDPTDLDSSRVSAHSNSDHVVQAGQYFFPGNIIAMAVCVDPSGQECLHWHLQMDTSKGPFDRNMKRAMVCHEDGHAVGLRHIGAAGCVTPIITADNRYWSSHDIAHINAYYA